MYGLSCRLYKSYSFKQLCRNLFLHNIHILTTNSFGTCLALTLSCSASCSASRRQQTKPKPTDPHPFLLEQHMTALTNTQFCPRSRPTVHTYRPRRLTTIIAGLLLTMMPLLTGCGGGETGSDPSITVAPGSAGATASLAWSPVADPSVIAYFVHYGRQSPGQSGSCSYESSVHADSPSATVTNLDPNTLYYFTVSAYNGLESACSNEVSTVTPPAPV